MCVSEVFVDILIHLKFKKCTPHEAMKIKMSILLWKPTICQMVMEACSTLGCLEVHTCILLLWLALTFTQFSKPVLMKSSEGGMTKRLRWKSKTNPRY